MRSSGDQRNGSPRLPGAGGRGVTGSIHSSTLCVTRYISGTTYHYSGVVFLSAVQLIMWFTLIIKNLIKEG